MVYQIGDKPVLTANFTDVDGPFNPDAVVLNVHKPSEIVEIATLNPETGTFTGEVELDEPGKWKYVFLATGEGHSAQRGEFLVEPDTIETWWLVTLEEAKRHLRIDSEDHDEDVFEKIADASAIIMDYLKLTAVPAAWTTVPFVVEAAVLLVLGELFQKREASDVDLISLGVQSLLARKRDLALA